MTDLRSSLFSVRRSLAAAALTLTVSAPAVAQGFCATIPNNSPSTGTCSEQPMGGKFSQVAFRAQRTQFVVTAAELGNQPRNITNLAFAACGTGVREYGRMWIYMAHHTGPLSTTFTSNYASGARTKVFDDSRIHWPNQADQWNNVGLERAFAYTPTKGDLLIDIMFNNADFSGSEPRMHSGDGRQCLYASGFSSTPRTGTLANHSVKVRLCDGAGFIDHYETGCGRGPLRLNATGSPTLGGTVNLQITGGDPSSTPSLAGILIGDRRAKSNLDQFCDILVSIVTVPRTPVSNGSSAPLPLMIPNIPHFVGGKIYMQGVNYDPGATQFGFAMSQRVVMTIGR